MAIKKDTDEGEWMTAREVGKWMGVSHNTVYESCRKGQLPHAYIGRSLRLFKPHLLEMSISGSWASGRSL